MGKIAVVSDSNSGITQEQAKAYGIYVLPMPFFINEETYFEDCAYSYVERTEQFLRDGNDAGAGL